MTEKLTELFQCMWRTRIQTCIHNNPPIDRYKRKQNPQVCYNHRGISLLSIAGTDKNLLNRLNEHLDQAGLLPERQCSARLLLKFKLLSTNVPHVPNLEAIHVCILLYAVCIILFSFLF